MNSFYVLFGTLDKFNNSSNFCTNMLTKSKIRDIMLYMKRVILKEMLAFPALGVLCLLYTACPQPNPLYGTWSDNRGNTFSFYDDGTFNARVTIDEDTDSYEGNYSVLLNALTLSCTNVELRVVTEWDIRGNMLYLEWTNEERVAVSMTLYKVSN